jgi:hypothetical protein
MNLSYHDTTNEPVQLNIVYEQKARDQDRLILGYFKALNTPLSPSQIFNILMTFDEIPKDTPLTSIRRAITNLTKRGLLRKTDKKVIGKYGRQEYLWEKA